MRSAGTSRTWRSSYSPCCCSSRAGNLLLLLVGWGLVGLASYLLIGFYHERPEAVAAAKKAFVMNAIGDAAMALGFFLLICKVGLAGLLGRVRSAARLDSTDGEPRRPRVARRRGRKVGAAPSADLAPDAMEGPTPVSALIHAATMVTAGVYLIVRTHPFFGLAPTSRTSPPVSARATRVIAGLIALVQTDIKRVIAYCTMSQIGYMFLGGLGAYSTGCSTSSCTRSSRRALPRSGPDHPPPRRRAGRPHGWAA